MPGLAERHARRSPGLQAALVAIALALTGRPGSRLAAKLGMAVSRSTLLRMIRGLPDPPVSRVAVDEFALRRCWSTWPPGTVRSMCSWAGRPSTSPTGCEPTPACR